MSASVSSRELFEVRTTTGCVRRLDHAELGDRDLEVREDLEQHRLELLVRLVDLVDQQHDRLGRRDRLHQRPRQEEVVGEDVLPAPPARRWPGSAAAACGSSTRRAPWPRRGPRSTGGGSARGRSRARSPSPAPSCRRRRGPRPGPACRARARGRRRARRARRPGIRRPRAPASPRRPTASASRIGRMAAMPDLCRRLEDGLRPAPVPGRDGRRLPGRRLGTVGALPRSRSSPGSC